MNQADVITQQADVYRSDYDTYLYLVRDGIVTRCWPDGLTLTTELSPDVVRRYATKIDTWPEDFKVPSNYADL
jgi:hypothetical protein